jgi:hypothetical protein
MRQNRQRQLAYTCTPRAQTYEHLVIIVSDFIGIIPTNPEVILDDKDATWFVFGSFPRQLKSARIWLS